MIRKIIIITVFVILFGCVSTPDDKHDYSNLSLSDGELLKEKWNGLERFAARYPLDAAKSRKVGCATVEYVITPDYEIQDVALIEASDRVFSRNSIKVISNWKWSNLPKDLLSSAVKTQTRFNFCLESEAESCAEVIQRLSCAGKDSISSIGALVKRQSMVKTPPAGF